MIHNKCCELYAQEKTIPLFVNSEASLDALVQRYASLVKRIAHHLTGRMPANISVDDMIQSGMIGLIEAAQKYDPDKGASFETYAGIRIRGAMLDEVRKGDWAPRSVHRNSRRVAAAIKQVEHHTGRDAKDSEISQALGVTSEEYHSMLQDSMATKLFSLSDLFGDDDVVLIEKERENTQYEPLANVQKEDLLTSLCAAIKQLPEREQLVLALYYDEELNLKEIGEVLGVSESRVSQIHAQAAHRLRSRMQDWKT